MAQNTFPEKIKLIVQSPDETLFEGEAYAVSSINQKGEFDILPGHTNFVSLITDILVIHISETESKDYPITTGLLKVADNSVEVYLGVDSVKTDF